jgi:hypothetical protein
MGVLVNLLEVIFTSYNRGDVDYYPHEWGYGHL